ncbi:MAG: GNAT family N-acetyltransferase [Ardenticatenales bacterium]|nr:GNAT family N-acetyltransferase [Ardenticatenales bacterium]
MAQIILEDYTIRRYQPGEEQKMVDLVNAGRDGVWETLVTVDMIRDEWGDARLDLAHDTWAAVNENGDYIAVAEVWFEGPTSEGESVTRHIGFTLHPDHREGHTDLLEHLFSLALERARSRPHDEPGKKYYLRAWAAANDAWKHDWIRARGFEHVHIGCTMICDALETLPLPSAVEGIRIEPWSPERDQDLWLALNEGFKSEETFTPLTWAEWKNLYHSERMDPALWHLAVDVASNKIAGFALNEIDYEANEESGRLDGWVIDLTVLPEWRNQGFGTVLLLSAVQTFREAGMTAVKVGVDSTETENATTLYESLGFRVMQGSCTYRRLLNE